MPNFTKSQLDAITTTGHDLLVSAAAGSGKTTALTERIVRRIEGGVDIGRLLIVTFSRASAADMKKKLADALLSRAETTGDRRLLRQSARLGEAEIGTIHSFCYSLLRRHSELCGLPAKLRVPDDAEAKLLREECMNDTVDAFYESDSGDGIDPAADIVALADHIAGSRDDAAMTNTLLSLYEKTSCLTRRFYAIEDSADALEHADADTFLDSDAGKYIKRAAKDGVHYYAAIMERACADIAAYDKYAEKYMPSFVASLDSLRRVEAALDGGTYGDAAAAIDAYSSPRLGIVKGEKPPEVEFYCSKRTETQKYLATIRREYFSADADTLASSLSATASVCRGIVRVLSDFDRRYREEKRRRGLVDYDDLEHMAYELLLRPDVRDEIAADYDEIYIDEYQDVNTVQDAIFSLLSRGEHGSRFMVGDVKQSIYGFRGADPTIFDRHRRTLDTVFMQENFRCDAPVVDFVNDVCGQLLPHGNVTYETRDELRHAKTDAAVTSRPRVIVTGRDGEAAAVADIAANAVSDGYRPDDIAILLRSAKSRGGDIADALRARGIPVQNDTQANFFECPEVLLVLCLLHVCDSPLYDVYTAGALRSPVFGFSLDDLSRLSSCSEHGEPLWYKIKTAANETNGGGESELMTDAVRAKCRDAYETINRWREVTRTMTADEVIRLIYDETGIESLLWTDVNAASGSPQLRADNLSALYDYARGFESGGYRGLHRFVAYVDSIVEGGVNSPVRTSGQGGTVRIMTIHQSKGLEFPVVIVAGGGSARNESDVRSSVLWSRTAGAAMKLRANASSTVMIDTLPRRGVAAAVADEGTAEEMRILYVALTRAKERLFITSAVADPEKVAADAKREAEFFSAHTVRREKTALGWILTSLYASGNDSADVEIRADANVANVEDVADVEDAADADIVVGNDNAADGSQPQPHADNPDEDEVNKYRKLIRERLDYRYPYERIGSLPAKLSVSRLRPDILDSADEDAVSLVSVKPSASEGPNESALAGTATHIYMQFCNFDAASHDAKAEGERLLSLGYIALADFDRIRWDEIEAFFRSDIYARISSSSEVWRERRFNVRLPASDFTENDDDRELYKNEELLVQGVIDCFFRERGGIVLLDYKTDRLSPYELSHPDAAARVLRERHSRQLGYYRAALTRIFGEPPAHTYVYSMALGDTVEIN